MRVTSPKGSCRGLAALFVMSLALLCTVTSPTAQQGGITSNSGLIPFDQAFFAFEVAALFTM